MPRVNKQQIPGLIQARQEFYGSSLWAEHSGETYRIYYLDTVLATVTLEQVERIEIAEPGALSKVARQYRDLVTEALNKPRTYPR